MANPSESGPGGGPAVPYERPAETQAAVAAERERLGRFPAQGEALRQALAPLEARVRELEGLRDRLQAIGAGEAPEIRAARDSAQTAYARQAAEFRPMADAATRKRRQLLALLQAQRLAFRDLLDALACQEPLVQAVRDTAGLATKDFRALEQWIAVRRERWRPKVPPRKEFTVEEILKVIPDPDPPPQESQAAPIALDPLADEEDDTERPSP